MTPEPGPADDLAAILGLIRELETQRAAAITEIIALEVGSARSEPPPRPGEADKRQRAKQLINGFAVPAMSSGVTDGTKLWRYYRDVAAIDLSIDVLRQKD
jgi:hypothetical protein